MILRHIHLPNLTSYTHASNLQANIVLQFLAHKASPTTTIPPSPTIITAQFHPVYTCGRREVGSVSDEQRAYLTQMTPWGKAEFHEALRGGQTTFHGPGQLVAYPIIDLKRHGLTARCYVRYLEKTVISLLSNSYGISAKTTDNPGVWTDDMHKICAVGVHLRRNVSSHGIGLNISTELGWLDRIVACGLEGKKTTSLKDMGREAQAEEVGRLFVERFAEGLEGVDAINATQEQATQ